MAGKQELKQFDYCKLYVTGIPGDLSDEAFINFLVHVKCAKPLRRVKLHRGQNRDFAYTFLEYENPKIASDALHLLHLRHPYLLKVKYAFIKGENEGNKFGNNREESNEEEWFKKVDGPVEILYGNENEKSSYSDFFELSSVLDEMCPLNIEPFSDLESKASTSPSSTKNSDVNEEDREEEYQSDDEEEQVVVKNWNRDIPLSFMELIHTDELVRLLPTEKTQCSTCAKPPFIDHVHYICDDQDIISPVFLLPPLANGICRICQTESDTIKFCGGCKKIMYCSDTCQLLDWRRHSDECYILQRSRKTVVKSSLNVE